MRGLQVITHRKRTIPNQLMLVSDKLLLRKRAIIERILDQLKNISHIEHTRHRSPINVVVNLSAGLVAYGHQLKKPPFRLDVFPRLEAVIPD